MTARGDSTDHPDYLPPYLTDQRLDTILYRGDSLLIFARHVAHLIRASHTRSDECLTTTFINKAALELKDHIQQKLSGVNVELIPVSTRAFLA